MTSARGGVAGALATLVMTLEQPPDRRLLESAYDDVLNTGADSRRVPDEA